MENNKLRLLLAKADQTSENDEAETLIKIDDSMAINLTAAMLGGNSGCSNNGTCSGNTDCSGNGNCYGNGCCNNGCGQQL